MIVTVVPDKFAVASPPPRTLAPPCEGKDATFGIEACCAAPVVPFVEVVMVAVDFLCPIVREKNKENVKTRMARAF